MRLNSISRRLAGAIALAALAVTFGAQSARAETVTVACGAVGRELEMCTKLANAWASETKNTVKIVSVPNSTTERLALYQQLLAAGSSDIDVFEIDVIWPGILGDYFVDLSPYTKGDEKAHFPEIIANNTRDGKLIAMPIYTDAGLMFYRKDLLEKYGVAPPQTWDDLAAAAKKVQDAERAAGNGSMQGFVFQGKAYEGLTCDALEWVVSHNGGTIIDRSGKVTVNNPQAAAALDRAAGWIGTITPQGVLNYSEEEARGVFQSGNAVFMRNWPYAWGLSQGADSPVRGKVGILPIPMGPNGRHASTLGGWQMAVSKFSKHPEIAATLAVSMGNTQGQKVWAMEGGYTPTVKALYDDPDVIKANPFLKELYPSIVSAVPRPSTVTGTKYNQVSSEFWNAVYDVISGRSKGAAALAGVESRLNRLSRGGHW